ncbi:MAG: flagellar hook-basal body complex protein FliE [Gammaproteobacteria bacterium]|jgi:flagellar hook-basal body complex protein FliE|nr:flagellar hook-basal body complex protein FliE [Gammaproteobacteria bacterium]
MTDINATQLISQMRSMAAAAGGSPADGQVSAGGNFSDLLSQAVNNVNDAQQQSAELKEAFQRGEEGIDISRVMIASQKASIEFQLMMQVRNRLISAYQDVMNMQI